MGIWVFGQSGDGIAPPLKKNVANLGAKILL